MTALVTVIYLRGERSGQLGRSLGLWSATTHDALIRHALEGCGVPDGNIKAIQDSSRSFDSETGSAEEWAFAHGETVNSAYYVSKEGPVFYLELNAARQIGGRDGPR